MIAEVITINPKKAKELLKQNRNNRKLVKKKVEKYVKDMKEGRWKENGESIIMDKNNNFKDGQHRMEAVVEANYTYTAVLVRGVDPDVMDTIDTGSNRTLANVLEMDKVQYASLIAAMISKIAPFNNGTSIDARQGISNAAGLEFYHKQGRSLHSLAVISYKIYGKQITPLLAQSDIGFYHYVLAGYDMNETTTFFLNNICGIITKETNAASWVARQFAKARKQKTRLSPKWKLGVVIKAWNLYLSADPAVTSLHYNIDDRLPEIDKI